MDSSWTNRARQHFCPTCRLGLTGETETFIPWTDYLLPKTHTCASDRTLSPIVHSVNYRPRSGHTHISFLTYLSCQLDVTSVLRSESGKRSSIPPWPFPRSGNIWVWLVSNLRPKWTPFLHWRTRYPVRVPISTPTLRSATWCHRYGNTLDRVTLRCCHKSYIIIEVKCLFIWLRVSTHWDSVNRWHHGRGIYLWSIHQSFTVKSFRIEE